MIKVLAVLTCLASVDDGKATRFDDGNYHHKVATGAMFNPNSLTAAMRYVRLGTLVRVCHNENCRYLKINDHGPCQSSYCQRVRPDLLKRCIDLTPYAADELKIRGLGKVSVQLCGRKSGLMVCGTKGNH